MGYLFYFTFIPTLIQIIVLVYPFHYSTFKNIEHFSMEYLFFPILLLILGSFLLEKPPGAPGTESQAKADNH